MLAVEVVFTRSLNQQLTDKLTALAQGAAANAEFENNRTKIDFDFSSKGHGCGIAPQGSLYGFRAS